VPLENGQIWLKRVVRENKAQLENESCVNGKNTYNLRGCNVAKFYLVKIHC
jgi:hypothetical protein